jgi:hypothetical protein
MRRAPGRDVLVRDVDVSVPERVERIDGVVRPEVGPLAVAVEASGRVAAGLERRPVLLAARDRSERDVVARQGVLRPVVGTVAELLGAGLPCLVPRLGRREALRPGEFLRDRCGQLTLPQLGCPRRRGIRGVACQSPGDERCREQPDRGDHAEDEPPALAPATAVRALR